MLQQIDMAFNLRFQDPDEDVFFDHIEIRDSFLEFMSAILQGYTKFLKDPN